MTEISASITRVRQDFLTLVAAFRPELHRYAARLTGSVIEGEDIVQDALAKAFYTLGLTTQPPNLRPWLFRIVHNTALDFLKSHGRKYTDPREDLDEVVAFDDRPDAAVVRAALARFLVLPPAQRSATILKDVLGHSLEETADTMGTTVMAVKAALVRGRAKLKEGTTDDAPFDAPAREALDRYATLFNARDWDGVRALIGEDCRLDLVSQAARRGREVGMYFDRYAKEEVVLRPVRLEGELALAAHVSGATAPSYFVLLTWYDGRVTAIRDYRYVPYIAAEAAFEPLDEAP